MIFGLLRTWFGSLGWCFVNENSSNWTR